MPRTLRSLALFPLIVSLASLGCSDDPAAPETVKADDGSAGGSTGAGAGGSTGNTAGTSATGGTGGAVDPGNSNEKSYPAGPYGLNVGDTIRNLKFEGLKAPKASNYDTKTTDTIALSDYYNPTGDASKTLALVLTGAARWCGPCQDEASKSMGFWKYWNPKGVEFISAVVQDEDYQASTFVDLTAWASKYKLEYPVTIDPDSANLGAYFGQDAVPFNMVVDTRTMKIAYKIAGSVSFDQNNPTLKKLIVAQ